MYDVTFFTPQRMSELWEMVGGLLKFASPSVLIFVALTCVGMFLMIVINAVKKAANHDKENEDFDIKYFD